MKRHKRTTASFVRKFLPGLRRIATTSGRRWTVNGEDRFVSLQDVINAYGKYAQELAELMTLPTSEVM
jgi:hypothetical protein